jgi:hypothetical protein
VLIEWDTDLRHQCAVSAEGMRRQIVSYRGARERPHEHVPDAVSRRHARGATSWWPHTRRHRLHIQA